MNEWIGLGLALAAGAGLGLFYFGGLWLTVRQLPASRSPVLLFLGSFVARLAVLLFGLYLVTGGRWQALLASLVGILAVRTLLLRRWRPAEKEGLNP